MNDKLIFGLEGGIKGGYLSRAVALEVGLVDSSSLLSWYEKEPEKAFNELTSITQQIERIMGRDKYLVLKDLLKTDNHLIVNGMNAEIKHSYRIYSSNEARVAVDTSTQSAEIGKGKSLFALKLNKRFSQGDKLSYGAIGGYGMEVIVSEEIPIEQEGDAWVHWVRLVTSDEYATMPPQFLQVGIEWHKKGHALGEFSTQYSGIENNMVTGMVENTFILGNHLGVEVGVTQYANSYNYRGANDTTKNLWDMLDGETKAMAKNNGVFFYGTEKEENGKRGIDRKSIKIGTTLQQLAFREFTKLQNIQCAFGRSATIKDGNNVKITNEGIYHQYRRGYRVITERPNVLNISTLRQVASIIKSKFYVDSDVQLIVNLRSGSRFAKNAYDLFLREGMGQIQTMSPLLGQERILPNPIVTGKSNQSLNPIQPIMFNGMYIPHDNIIFKVEIDPALDFSPSKNTSGVGYIDGSPISSFSAYIDMAEFIRTNQKELFKNVEGTPKINYNSNVYKITPEEGMMRYGFKNGRYSLIQTTEILSSDKSMSAEYWIQGATALLLAEIDKSIVIELNAKLAGY